jgi:hypothetical protein
MVSLLSRGWLEHGCDFERLLSPDLASRRFAKHHSVQLGQRSGMIASALLVLSTGAFEKAKIDGALLTQGIPQPIMS